MEEQILNSKFFFKNNFLKKLPFTFNYLRNLSNLRFIDHKTINISIYKTQNYIISGHHKPISKIISDFNFNKHGGK